MVQCLLVNVETYNRLECRKLVSVEFSLTNGTSVSHTLSLRLRGQNGRTGDFKSQSIGRTGVKLF